MSALPFICSKCGAHARAACNCGVEYVPARERAAAAVAANPEKSNRAIAGDIGVSEPTVRRARSGASYDAPEKRVGQDGKNYPAKRKAMTAKDAKEFLALTPDEAVARCEAHAGEPLNDEQREIIRRLHADRLVARAENGVVVVDYRFHRFDPTSHPNRQTNLTTRAERGLITTERPDDESNQAEIQITIAIDKWWPKMTPEARTRVTAYLLNRTKVRAAS